MKKCEVIFNAEAKRQELSELEQEAAAPGFWNDQEKARANIDKCNVVRAVLEPFDKLVTGTEDADVMLELAEAESDEAERERTLGEVLAMIEELERKFRDVEMRSLLSGKLDRNNVYMSLHAGAGGTESCDWADMLMRMYMRYAERHGFDISVMDYQSGEEAGIKSSTVLVSGAFAYGYLKGERGVHRLVRISPFDANKRRHTSFVAMDVIAELDDDIEINIDRSEYREDTYRASGAGGQHVNKTDSAIRLTHIASGIVVQCQAERSQHKNRAKALKMLAAKLYEYEMDKKRKEMEKFYGNKGEIAWGSQIRSYVLQPYTMVTDHRTETKVGNVAGVLDGDLDIFIEKYLKQIGRKDGHSA